MYLERNGLAFFQFHYRNQSVTFSISDIPYIGKGGTGARCLRDFEGKLAAIKFGSTRNDHANGTTHPQRATTTTEEWSMNEPIALRGQLTLKKKAVNNVLYQTVQICKTDRKTNLNPGVFLRLQSVSSIPSYLRHKIQCTPQRNAG